MIAVGRDAYLISSSRMLLGATTDLQVITVRKDIPYTKNVVSSVTLQQTIAHIVSLSACTGLFVGIGATAVNDLYVVTGIVDPVTRVINLFNVSAHYGRNFSPMITRLSDTEFAIAYSTMSSQLMTRYGEIFPLLLQPCSLVLNAFIVLLFYRPHRPCFRNHRPIGRSCVPDKDFLLEFL